MVCITVGFVNVTIVDTGWEGEKRCLSPGGILSCHATRNNCICAITAIVLIHYNWVLVGEKSRKGNCLAEYFHDTGKQMELGAMK